MLQFAFGIHISVGILRARSDLKDKKQSSRLVPVTVNEEIVSPTPLPHPQLTSSEPHQKAKVEVAAREPNVGEAEVRKAGVREPEVREAGVREAEVREAKTREAEVREAKVREAKARERGAREVAARARRKWGALTSQAQR